LKTKTNNWYRKECVKVAKLIAKQLAKYRCINPGCHRTAENGFQMHGSHILSEGKYHRMSVEVKNIMCQCAYHHIDWHENPLLQGWFEERFPGLKKELLEMDKELSKIKPDYKKILEVLKERYNNLIN